MPCHAIIYYTLIHEILSFFRRHCYLPPYYAAMSRVITCHAIDDAILCRVTIYLKHMPCRHILLPHTHKRWWHWYDGHCCLLPDMPPSYWSFHAIVFRCHISLQYATQFITPPPAAAAAAAVTLATLLPPLLLVGGAKGGITRITD